MYLSVDMLKTLKHLNGSYLGMGRPKKSFFELDLGAIHKGRPRLERGGLLPKIGHIVTGGKGVSV